MPRKEISYAGKIASFDNGNNTGKITMNNGEIIGFSSNDCAGFVHFDANVNVLFKVRYNMETALNEGYDIRMTKQDILDGRIVKIDRLNKMGYIKNDNTSYRDILKFNSGSCKEFNKLVRGDCITYALHYARKGAKVINIQLNEERNIIKRNAKGVIVGINHYRKNDNKVRFTLIFVYIKELKCDVCVRLNGINTKYSKGLRVKINVYQDVTQVDRYGNKIENIYGKYLVYDVYDIHDKVRKQKMRKNIKQNKNDNSFSGIKRKIMINNESKEDVITLNEVRKGTKVMSLDDIMKQETLNREAIIAERERQRQEEQDRQMDVGLDIMEEIMRNNVSQNIKKSINKNKNNVVQSKPDPIPDPMSNISVNNDSTNNSDISSDDTSESVDKQDQNNVNTVIICDNKKKNVVTIDMIKKIKKRICKLNKELSDMIEIYKKQKNDEVNQEINDITSNYNYISDYNGSINDSEYSHASQ